MLLATHSRSGRWAALVRLVSGRYQAVFRGVDWPTVVGRRDPQLPVMRCTLHTGGRSVKTNVRGSSNQRAEPTLLVYSRPSCAPFDRLFAGAAPRYHAALHELTFVSSRGS